MDEGEGGGELSEVRAAGKVCTYCGCSGLKWAQFDQRWRLADPDGTAHKCDEYRLARATADTPVSVGPAPVPVGKRGSKRDRIEAALRTFEFAQAELRRAIQEPDEEFVTEGAQYRVVMYCLQCGTLHVDRGEWATRPHHKHLCEACGFVWRVDPYAVGVEPKAQPSLFPELCSADCDCKR